MAALYVVLHHSVFQVWSPGRSSPPSLVSWLLYGRFAVDLFIVLSGYCLALPVLRDGLRLRKGIPAFYAARARRILPTYYWSLLFSAILATTLISRPTGTHWDISIPVTWQSVVSCVLMLQQVWEPGKINSVYWSVAVEWWIYLLFPAFVLAWSRLGLVVVAVLVAALAIVISGPAGRAGLSGLNVQYLALFAFGALGASITTGSGRSTWLFRKIPWGIAVAFFIGPVVAFAAARGFESMVWRWLPFDLALGLGWSALLIHLESESGSLFRALFSWAPFVRAGAIAYSVYLVHMPLLQVFHQYVIMPFGLSDRWEFLCILLLAVPFALIGAFLFSRWFEPHSRKTIALAGLR